MYLISGNISTKHSDCVSPTSKVSSEFIWYQGICIPNLLVVHRSYTSRDLCNLIDQIWTYIISKNICSKYSSCKSSTSRDLCSLEEQFLIHIISRNMFTNFANCNPSTYKGLCILVVQFQFHTISGNMWIKFVISSSSNPLSFVLFVCTLQLVIFTGYIRAALYILFAVHQSWNQTRWENEREARRGVLFLRLSRFSNSMPKLLH